QCSSGLPIVVRDSAGHTATVTVSNLAGTQTPTDVVVAPDEVTLGTCQEQASITAAGGTGSYFIALGSNALTVTGGANGVFTVRRRVPSPAVVAVPSDVLVGISDGRTSATATVHLVGAGAGICP